MVALSAAPRSSPTPPSLRRARARERQERGPRGRARSRRDEAKSHPHRHHRERHGADRAGRVPLDHVPGPGGADRNGKRRPRPTCGRACSSPSSSRCSPPTATASWPASTPTPAPARATTSPRRRCSTRRSPTHRSCARVGQAHGRLDQPPLLLDLPGDHGRLHRHPVRLHLRRAVPPHADLHPAGRRSAWSSPASCGYIAYRGHQRLDDDRDRDQRDPDHLRWSLRQHPVHRLPARPRPRRSTTLANAGKVVIPHNFMNVLYQSTIAILLLVGFESVTALGAEAINPEKDIKRGVLLSLIIQGGICYLFEYFAANFAVGDRHGDAHASGNDHADRLRGGGGRSGADRHHDPQHRREVLGHTGTTVSLIVAATVLLALIGTTLACLNTGVRVTYAMARDKEMPSILGLLHGKFATPHGGIWILTGALGRSSASTAPSLQGRQPHPDHPGLQHGHLPRVRHDLRRSRSSPSPAATTSTSSSTTWSRASAASMNLAELFGVVYLGRHGRRRDVEGRLQGARRSSASGSSSASSGSPLNPANAGPARSLHDPGRKELRQHRSASDARAPMRHEPRAGSPRRRPGRRVRAARSGSSSRRRFCWRSTVVAAARSQNSPMPIEHDADDRRRGVPLNTKNDRDAARQVHDRRTAAAWRRRRPAAHLSERLVRLGLVERPDPVRHDRAAGGRARRASPFLGVTRPALRLSFATTSYGTRDRDDRGRRRTSRAGQRAARRPHAVLGKLSWALRQRPGRGPSPQRGLRRRLRARPRPTTRGTAARCWVVADGMGGHAAGEVASRIAVGAALIVGRRHRLGRPPQPRSAARVRAANMAVHDAGRGRRAGGAWAPRWSRLTLGGHGGGRRPRRRQPGLPGPRRRAAPSSPPTTPGWARCCACA